MGEITELEIANWKIEWGEAQSFITGQQVTNLSVDPVDTYSCMLMCSNYTVGLLFKLTKFSRPIEIDLSKVFVCKLCLIDGPARQGVVEVVKTDGFASVHFGPVLLHVKGLNQFSVHQQKQVQSLHVCGHVAFAEVRIELLQCEMLENLLTLGLEETSNFFHSRVLLEKIGILKLAPVLGVVAHQVLSQEDAGVETSANLWVDLVLALSILVCQSVDLARQ